MRRLMSFFLGMVTGAMLRYGALNYHVVRAQDGFHLIPKLDQKLAATYVDIRNFTVADWTQRPDLAAAMMKADKADLMRGSAIDSLENTMDRLLDRAKQPQQ